MKKTWKKLLVLGLGALMLTACSSLGDSGKKSDFPNTQLNMIVQASPGGLSDQVSKETGDLMGKVLGQTVICQYKPGGSGSGGCEIYAANEDGDKLWKALWEAGEEFGLKNIGLGARDTLRLEKGFCLYGNDIDDTTSPLEGGLGWITKFAEGKEFIDRPLLEKQKAEGVTRRLVGFKMIDRGIPRHGYEIAAPDGTRIGHVTSGTMSPCMKVGFGLGYVTPEYAKAGTEIAVVVREKPLRAEVVKIPFV